MGNTHPDRGYETGGGWKIVGRVHGGEIVRDSQGAEVEVYTVRIPDDSLKEQISIYHKRKNKPGSWVRVIDYRQKHSATCGYTNSYLVVTERIKRLEEVKTMTQ